MTTEPNDSYARIVAELRAPNGMASQGDCDAWADRLEKLSAASVQVTRDAERYRWMRANPHARRNLYGGMSDLDEAIDARLSPQGADHGR